MDNFSWYGFNRPYVYKKAKKGSGGVGILVKKSILSLFKVKVIDKKYDGIMALHFNSDSFIDFIVCVCYLQPFSSVHANSTEFFVHLTSLLYSNNDCNVIFICGDFNARIGNTVDMISLDNTQLSRQVIDFTKNSYCDVFIDFLKDCNLCILNGRITQNLNDYTFFSSRRKSVVDYFLTPNENLRLCKSCKVTPISSILEVDNAFTMLTPGGCPDHSVITLIIGDLVNTIPKKQVHDKINSQDLGINKQNKQHFVPWSPRKYSIDRPNDNFMNNNSWKINLNQLICDFESNLRKKGNINHLYDKLCSIVFMEMDKYLDYTDSSKRSKKRLKSSKPFWNSELTLLWKNMKDKEKELRKYRGCNKAKNKLHNEYKISQAKFDKCLRNTERNYFRAFGNDIEAINTRNPKEFWNKIKQLGPQKSNISDQVLLDDGSLTKDKNTVFQKWVNDFKGLYNKDINCNNDIEYNIMNIEKSHMEQFDNSDNENALNSCITTKEVQSVIRKLKNNKSVGIDKIPNEILKLPSLLQTLTLLLNNCLTHGYVPGIWLKSLITPVPKGKDKDPNVPLNYRGISLISCVSKVYSGLLNKRLVNYLDENKCIVEEQNGFRPGRSCEEHVFTLHSVIQNRLNDNKDTFVAFIDMCKAFDWIDRSLLLYKLLKMNISGKIYFAIKSLLMNTYSCIKLQQALSDWFHTASGVRQGNPLSPTLFNIFINDLAVNIKNLNLGIKMGDVNLSILLYADDIAVIAESEKDLQTMLNYVHEWCNKWKLLVNGAKSQVVHFRKHRRPRTSFKFLIGESELDIVSFYRYLGVIFDEYLNFKQCEEILADAAGRALGGVIHKLKQIKYTNICIFKKLYESCVIPIMDYNCSVWANYHCKYGEKIQLRAQRYFLGVHNKAPIDGICGDLGWMPTKYRRYIAMCRFWNRLVKLDDTRLPRKLLNFEFVNDNNTKSWFQMFKGSMGVLGISEMSMSFHFNTRLLSTILLEKAQTDWKEAIKNKPKLRSYRQFKKNFGTQNYVSLKIPKNQRSLIAKLRLGILPIALETGRFTNTPLNERNCFYCIDKIEDEFHLVCNCKMYTDLRETLYQSMLKSCPTFNEMSDKDKFLNIMESDLRCLHLYLEKAWNLRKTKLFVSQQ